MQEREVWNIPTRFVQTELSIGRASLHFFAKMIRSVLHRKQVFEMPRGLVKGAC